MSAATEDALRRCPIDGCGCAARYNPPLESAAYIVRVVCDGPGCGFQGPVGTPARARSLWNKLCLDAARGRSFLATAANAQEQA